MKLLLSPKFNKAFATGLAVYTLASIFALPVGQALAEDYQGNAIQEGRFRQQPLSLGPQEEACYTPGTGKGSQDERVFLMTQLAPLLEKSVVAREIFEGTKKLNTTFCAKDYSGFNFDGEYNHVENKITLNNVDTPQTDTEQLHEAMHALQYKNSGVNFNHHWSLESNIRRTVYREVSARVAEIAISFELKQKGDSDSWDHLLEITPANIMEKFKNTYLGSSSANFTHRQALERAGSAAWKEMLTNKEWVDYYTAQTIRTYMNNFIKPFVSMSAETDPPDTAHLSGKINDTLNLTRYVTPPKFEDMYKDSANLFHIAHALEFQRARHLFGAEDARTKALLQLGSETRNPYLGIDFKEVRRQMEGRYGQISGTSQLEGSVASTRAENSKLAF